MMSIHTHTGDEGTTFLATGEKVSKSDERVEAYGTLDELSAFIGVLKDVGKFSEETLSFLTDIQKNLQVISARFAGYDKVSLPSDAVERLESAIDAFKLPPLRDFEIPGGNLSASYCHVCRTVCRRAERLAVKMGVKGEDLRYLNRLSDYFFELSRTI